MLDFLKSRNACGEANVSTRYPIERNRVLNENRIDSSSSITYTIVVFVAPTPRSAKMGVVKKPLEPFDQRIGRKSVRRCVFDRYVLPDTPCTFRLRNEENYSGSHHARGHGRSLRPEVHRRPESRNAQTHGCALPRALNRAGQYGSGCAALPFVAGRLPWRMFVAALAH